MSGRGPSTSSKFGKGTECGTIVLLQPQGGVQSPTYPQPYSNNTLCGWVIYAPEGHLVKEPPSSCSQLWLCNDSAVHHRQHCVHCYLMPRCLSSAKKISERRHMKIRGRN
ncbi:cubilin-like [Myxocyprinus asiaticus]|uniref:cubilin-like n=1 Tax=Myxocyprinus asiaticus TaxID=70543 RepID=UPI002222B21C|nr:cubilin-like [Myxocyprinus asiaticus]